LDVEYTGERASGESSLEEESSQVAQDSGVPVGVIVGAIVGGVAAIALLSGAVFFFKRRAQRKSRAARDVRHATSEQETWALTETSQHKLSTREPSQYPVHEMEGYSRAAELSSHSPTRAELSDHK